MGLGAHGIGCRLGCRAPVPAWVPCPKGATQTEVDLDPRWIGATQIEVDLDRKRRIVAVASNIATDRHGCSSGQRVLAKKHRIAVARSSP